MTRLPALVVAIATACAANAAAQATRADFADAYQRFERAYAEHHPSGAALADVNRAFDRLTVAFFGGDTKNAMRELAELTASVAGRERTPDERALDTLKLRVDPPTAVGAGPFTVSLRVTQLYREELDHPLALTLHAVVTDASGDHVQDAPIELVLDPDRDLDAKTKIALPDSAKAPCTGSIRLVAASGAASRSARFRVARASFDATRAANCGRIDALRGATPVLADAIACCRARNEILRDKPSEMTTTQWVLDPFRIAAEVDAEIDALADSIDPYRRRAGDLWRTIDLGPRLPLRVFAPQRACGKDPAPLVIVLHGAGGDENMWLDGYGAGRIERLAEERGFLVVSPLSYVFTEAPESITLLIERIAAEYPVDASRVYLIGHSLGAVAASRIIETEPDLFAGCVCFSGGRAFAPGAELPPLLYMQGALDPIMAPSRTRAIVDALRAAGKENVELREFENVGHTLIVNDQLGAAVDWLLARKR